MFFVRLIAVATPALLGAGQALPASAIDAQNPTAASSAPTRTETSRSERNPVRELLEIPPAARTAEWVERLQQAARAALLGGDGRTAKAAFEALLEMRERMQPKDALSVARARIDLAHCHRVLGEHERARELKTEALAIVAASMPENHPELQECRAELASTLHDLGEFGPAREWMELAIEELSKSAGGLDPVLLRMRASFVTFVHDAGDVARAKALGLKLLDELDGSLPEDDPVLLMVLSNHARAHIDLREFADARAVLERVIDVRARTLPEEHPKVMLPRSNLGLCLYQLGDLHGARALYELVLPAMHKTYPADHVELLIALENYAGVLSRLGEPQRAVAHLQRLEAARARTLPPDDSRLTNVQVELAVVKDILGDNAGARMLLEQVIDVLARTLPGSDPRLISARGNLALVLMELGDANAAREIQAELLDELERVRPDDTIGIQHARGNLAWSLRTLGELARAEELEEGVLDVLQRLHPEGHTDLERARENLALTRCALGEPRSALELQERVLAQRVARLPPEHIDVIAARVNLVFVLGLEAALHACGHSECESNRLCVRNRRPFEETERLCSHAIAAARQHVLLGSARESEAFCTDLARCLDVVLSFEPGIGVLPAAPELAEPAFLLSEVTRGAGLVSSAGMRRARGSTEYANARGMLQSRSDRLAAVAQTGTTSAAFDRAVQEREAAERTLIDLSRSLPGGGGGLRDIEVGELSRQLGPRRAAIAFRIFTRWMYEPWNGLGRRPPARPTRSLCAFVVRGTPPAAQSTSASPLSLVHLGPAEPIERAVREWRSAVGATTDRGRAVTSRARAELERHGVDLRQRVLDPVHSLLADADRIVVVPDDVLHLVPLDALPDADGQRLVGDRFKIEIRASLTELMQAEANPCVEGLVALGGASFNSEPLALAAGEGLASTSAQPSLTAELSRGTAWERGFPPLPHAALEVQGVGALFSEAFEERHPAILIDKRKASRAALIELAPRARFLHVATHGWSTREAVRTRNGVRTAEAAFSMDSQLPSLELVRGVSPMLMSGLALAGANLPEDVLGRPPGLVTADELSTLDLSNCELAVISACDSSLGERQAGQGVASLQKALHMAGARSVITSLWKVPDEATKDLMLDFYRRLWIEKKPKWLALWEAKRRLREAKDELGDPIHSPAHWAAWVLTGSPE